MKFKVKYVSKPCSPAKIIVINSLEELKALQEKTGYRMVIDFEDYSIWIADDYLDTI